MTPVHGNVHCKGKFIFLNSILVVSFLCYAPASVVEETSFPPCGYLRREERER